MLIEYANQPSIPSSILKTALRTARKLLKNESFKQSLLRSHFDLAKQLKALYACKLEAYDPEQEEIILLLIQKIVIAAT